jgi:hypothetical protein
MQMRNKFMFQAPTHTHLRGKIAQLQMGGAAATGSNNPCHAS